MKQSATSQSIRSLQRLVDDLRGRNAVLHARVRFLKQQFQREHALHLASLEQIKELERLAPAKEPTLPLLGRRGGERGKGRKPAASASRGTRAGRKRG